MENNKVLKFRERAPECFFTAVSIATKDYPKKRDTFIFTGVVRCAPKQSIREALKAEFDMEVFDMRTLRIVHGQHFYKGTTIVQTSDFI